MSTQSKVIAKSKAGHRFWSSARGGDVVLCYLCACEVRPGSFCDFPRQFGKDTKECHAECWNEMRSRIETVDQFPLPNGNRLSARTLPMTDPRSTHPHPLGSALANALAGYRDIDMHLAVKGLEEVVRIFRELEARIEALEEKVGGNGL